MCFPTRDIWQLRGHLTVKENWSLNRNVMLHITKALLYNQCVWSMPSIYIIEDFETHYISQGWYIKKIFKELHFFTHIISKVSPLGVRGWSWYTIYLTMQILYCLFWIRLGLSSSLKQYDNGRKTITINHMCDSDDVKIFQN